MQIAALDDMIRCAQELGFCHLAVVAAHDSEVLQSIDEARERGIATATLFGDAARIEAIAQEKGLALHDVRVEHEPDEARAALRAMQLVRERQADVVIKGQIKTSTFLRAALDRQAGIRDRKLLSHVGVFEIPGFDRLLYMSDSGVVLYPTPMQKRTIIQNVVDVAHRLGIEHPRVAVLAANERVHPSRPGGVEALTLARMAQEGWISGAIVDGPLPLDVALYECVARLHGVDGPVAGRADVVIVPNVEAGNIAAKAIQYIGHGEMAGLVVGARVPIIINSRADDATTRLRSIAMAALVADVRAKSGPFTT